MRVSAFLLLFLISCTATKEEHSADIDREQMITINGADHYVRVIGEGEPVLVIHGGPLLDHSYLLPFLHPLSKDYQLIFYDQKLSGRSAAIVDSADVSIAGFVDDIKILQDSLNIKSSHILAHSWGGLLAMAFTSKYPERVGKLILANAIPPTAQLWQQENAILSSRISKEDSLEIAAITSSELFQNRDIPTIEELMEVSLRQQFYDRRKGDTLHIDLPDDYISRSRQLSYIMKDLMVYDMLEGLHNMDVPTLIIYGASEPAAGLSGEILADTIVDSKLLIIEEAGHFPFIEQQEIFISETKGFLQ